MRSMSKSGEAVVVAVEVAMAVAAEAPGGGVVGRSGRYGGVGGKYGVKRDFEMGSEQSWEAREGGRKK